MALRLMDFVSENQVEEEKELFKGGPRLQDRAVTNERPLYEILKENKDKKDSEFNEKIKHRPPKALDDDETEFLEAVEMHKREVELKNQEEDAEQIINFQAALASRTIPADEPRVFIHQQHERQEAPSRNKRPASIRVLPVSVKIKPLPKRTKIIPAVDDLQPKNKLEETGEVLVPDGKGDGAEDQKPTDLPQSGLLGLGSYGDDDDDDDDDDLTSSG